MNTERIPVDMIDDSDRLRPIDRDYAALIAASIAIKGVESPIKVRPSPKRSGGKPYRLIFGGHRLEASRIAGVPDIPAIIETMSDDEARLAEIDENVYRNELSDLDRAVFLAEKKRIHEKLYPQTGHGSQDRDAAGQFRVAIFGNTADRFTAEVQENLGLSERSIYRIIKRASIAPEVRASLAGTAFARNGAELDALVKLKEPALQLAAVRMVHSGAPDAPKTLALAAAKISGRYSAPQTDVQEIQYGTLRKDWKNAGAGARDRFLRQLRADGDERLDRLLSEVIDELVADGALTRFDEAA